GLHVASAVVVLEPRSHGRSDVGRHRAFGLVAAASVPVLVAVHDADGGPRRLAVVVGRTRLVLWWATLLAVGARRDRLRRRRARLGGRGSRDSTARVRARQQAATRPARVRTARLVHAALRRALRRATPCAAVLLCAARRLRRARARSAHGGFAVS